MKTTEQAFVRRVLAEARMDGWQIKGVDEVGVATNPAATIKLLMAVDTGHVILTKPTDRGLLTAQLFVVWQNQIGTKTEDAPEALADFTTNIEEVVEKVYRHYGV